MHRSPPLPPTRARPPARLAALALLAQVVLASPAQAQPLLESLLGEANVDLLDSARSADREEVLERVVIAGGPELCGHLHGLMQTQENASLVPALLRALGRLGCRAHVATLMQLATDTDQPDQATAALEALGRLRDPRALPFLVRLLRVGLHREAAALALWRTGQAALPAVRALVSTPGGAADTAAMALARLRPAGAAAVLQRGLSTRVLTPLAALEAMTELADPAALPTLQAYLFADQSEVRRQALAGLTALADPRAAPALVASLHDDELRLPVLALLRSLGAPVAPSPLLTLAGAGSRAQRDAAVLTLGRLGGPGAVAALTQLAARRPAAEREPVWVALQYHGSALSLEALRIAAFLGGPDAPAAALGLGTALRLTTRRGPDERRAAARALETLRLLARYTTGPLARAALLAAGRQGDGNDLDLLLERLARGTVAERRIAAAALGAHADDRADRALATALGQDLDPAVRAAAAWSLGRRTAQVAVEPLLGALRRPGDLAAINAAAALGRLGLRRLAPRLAARLDHVNPSVRANLAWALGQCRDDRALGRLRRLLRHDPATAVRRAAGLALARILGRRAARDLAEAAARESDLAVETDLREAEGVVLGWAVPRRRTGTARWLEVRLVGAPGRTSPSVVQVLRLADGMHLTAVTDESGALLLEDVAPGPAWLVGSPTVLGPR